MLALSYMRGPNIKDWVEDQANDLRTKTTRAINPIDRTEEALWTDFLATFNRMFTDTTRQQTAYHQLYQWKMQKDDLDNYYSRFQHLATRAGFDRDTCATIDLFAKGLKPQLLQAILNRDNTPNTMDKWIAAARREQQKYALKQTMLHPGKAWPMWETKPSKFNGGRTRHHPNDETVPMDVDSPTYSWVSRTWSDADKKKLSREGRCFQCGKLGHMVRNCPHKPKKQQKQQQSFKPNKGTYPNKKFQQMTSQARIAEIESDDNLDFEEDPPDNDGPDIPSLVARTAKFMETQKEEWVNEMKQLGVDFQTA